MGTGYPSTNAPALPTGLPHSSTSASTGLLPSVESGSAPVPSGIENSPLTGVCQSASTITVTKTNEVTVTVTASPEAGTTETGPQALKTSLPTTAVSVNSIAPLPATTTANRNLTATSSCSGRRNGTVASASTHLESDVSLSAVSSAQSTSANIVVGAVSNVTSQTQASGAKETAKSSSTGISPSGAPSRNATDANPAPADGEFWAGACIGTLPRSEAIPGRVFYDYDGKTVKDPVKTLGDAGLNAIRLQTGRGNCLGPTHFVNGPDTLSKELLFTNDFGCIDLQVELAQRSRAAGMRRFQLTINQGFNISKDMEAYSYEEMVDDVRKETKRQIQPFLDVGIVPDIILFENEGTDGFLYMEESTGHIRGTKDGKAPDSKVDAELCGKYPTGKMNSYPQYSGYLKAEMNACNEAIEAAGFSTDAVRYGLHSHGQYVQWKEGFVHGPDQHSQSDLKDASGASCPGPNVIPSSILAQNASEMLTIMGFSAYPDPMTPKDIDSASSQNATLDRLRKTLDQMQGYAEAYGKYTEGPFKGQWKLQGFGVEYATAFSYKDTAQEQQLTEMMWETVKGYSSFLGMLWWEPWYCYNDWQGGKATLCHILPQKGKTGEAPTELLKTWGKAAVSPWL